MNTKKFNPWFKAIASVVLLTFTATSIIPPSRAYAQSMPGGMMTLPAPGALLNLSPAHTPALLTGIQLNLDNPFQFEFLIQKSDDQLTAEQKQQEYSRLIKYFLTVLTVPEKELWVNLSPYEKNRIVSDDLGKTEMGRDMLALDYILKQLTASLMYPEGEAGKEFWKRIYAKAQEKFGTTEIPVNTFNRVWIVPQKAVVFEHNNTALVVESRLKVLLEEDLIALDKKLGTDTEHTKFASDSKQFAELQKEQEKDVNKLSSSIVREVILPEIEKEINEGKSFAQLRQIYNAMILAVWFKKRLKTSVFGEMYLDKKKMDGISLNDNSYKQNIYNQYVEAYKKGAYNLVKEEYDPASEETIPRKYFSGGVIMNMAMLSNQQDLFELLRGEKVDPRVSRALFRINRQGIDSVSIDMSLRGVADLQSVTAGNVTMGFQELDVLLNLSGNVAANRINQQVEAFIRVGADIEQIVLLKSLLLMFSLNTKGKLKSKYRIAIEENIRWLGAIQEFDQEAQRAIRRAALKHQAVLRALADQMNALLSDRQWVRTIEETKVTPTRIIKRAEVLLANDDSRLREIMVAPTEAKRRKVLTEMVQQATIVDRSRLNPVLMNSWRDPLTYVIAVITLCILANIMEDRQRSSFVSSNGFLSFPGIQAPQVPGIDFGFIPKLIFSGDEDQAFLDARERLEEAQDKLEAVQKRLQAASEELRRAQDEMLTKPPSAELTEKNEQAETKQLEAQLAVSHAMKEFKKAEVAFFTAELNRGRKIFFEIGGMLKLDRTQLEQAILNGQTFGNEKLAAALKQIEVAKKKIEDAENAVTIFERAIDELNIALGKTPKPVKVGTQYRLLDDLNWQRLDIDPNKTLAQNVQDYISDKGPFEHWAGSIAPWIIEQVMKDNGLKEGDPMPQSIFMRPAFIQDGVYGFWLRSTLAYEAETQSGLPDSRFNWDKMSGPMFGRLAEQKIAFGNPGVHDGKRVVTKDGTVVDNGPLKWITVEVKPGQSIQDFVQSYFGRPIDGVTENDVPLDQLVQKVRADNHIFDNDKPLPAALSLRPPVEEVYFAKLMRSGRSRVHFYRDQHDPQKVAPDRGASFLDGEKAAWEEWRAGKPAMTLEQAENPNRNRAMMGDSRIGDTGVDSRLLYGASLAIIIIISLPGLINFVTENPGKVALAGVGLAVAFKVSRNRAKENRKRFESTVVLTGASLRGAEMNMGTEDERRIGAEWLALLSKDREKFIPQIRELVEKGRLGENSDKKIMALEVLIALGAQDPETVKIYRDILADLEIMANVLEAPLTQWAKTEYPRYSKKIATLMGEGWTEDSIPSGETGSSRAMLNSSPGGIALDSQYLSMEFEGDPIVLEMPEEMQWIDMNAISGLSITGFKIQTVANPLSLPIFSGMKIK